MFKVLESSVVSKGLPAGARAAILSVTRGFDALTTEHSRALIAAAKAALPRTRLTDLRAMYTSPDRETDRDSLTTEPDR